MKRTTKVVLTLVLVGGVAAAVAGYSQNPFCGHWGSAEHRAERVVGHLGRKLDLTPEQVTKANALKDQLLSLHEATRAEREQGRETALELLASPTLDQQQALELVTRKTERVNELAPQVVAAVADFTDSLSPEQRAELHQMARDRLDRGQRRDGGDAERSNNKVSG